MKKKKYENVAELLYQVFNAAGKGNLLQLAQLRKVWFQKVDSFLAGHAYPHDLLSTFHFFINPACFEEAQAQQFSKPLQQFLKKMKSKQFQSRQHFWDQLEKRLKVDLSPEEKNWLQNNALFGESNLTLHLTVYDGSVTQAIHFNQKQYKVLFNQFVPGLKITAIESHVGDLSKILSAHSASFDTPLQLQIPSSSLEQIKSHQSSSHSSSKSSTKSQVQGIIQRLRERSLSKVSRQS